MTTAAEHEQPIVTGAERPSPETGPGGLILLPAVDGTDVGLCIDGVCRLPGAKG
jgi:hypothetical protein